MFFKLTPLSAATTAAAAALLLSAPLAFAQANASKLAADAARLATSAADASKAAATTSKVYIVQLAGAPLATYDGNVSGLTATRPAAGARLSPRSTAARAYLSHLDNRRAAVLARLGGTVTPLHTYGVTFNGFAAKMTEAQARSLLGTSDVVAVIESEQRLMDTTRTTDFLGLSGTGGVWSQLDALSRNVKGEDVIIGVIDSGTWPENPSVGSKVNAQGVPVGYAEAGTEVYGPPPARWTGTCVTAEGFTPAMCSNKLIGARYYVDAFLAGGAVLGANEYVSPRDGGGHGSHTMTTAGGNAGVRIAATNGVVTGVMSAFLDNLTKDPKKLTRISHLEFMREAGAEATAGWPFSKSRHVSSWPLRLPFGIHMQSSLFSASSASSATSFAVCAHLPG